MNKLTQLIEKYESDIKRLDNRIVSNREHPSRTYHFETLKEAYEVFVVELRSLQDHHGITFKNASHFFVGFDKAED